MWRVQLRSFFAILGAFAVMGCPRTTTRQELPTPPLIPTPAPAPTPPPAPFVPNKKLETGRIFNGMQYKVTLETEVGTTATRDRDVPENYQAELTVKVKVPKIGSDVPLSSSDMAARPVSTLPVNCSGCG